MLNRPKKWNISIIFVNILGDPVGRTLKLKTIWTPDIGNIEPDIHPGRISWAVSIPNLICITGFSDGVGYPFQLGLLPLYKPGAS